MCDAPPRSRELQFRHCRRCRTRRCRNMQHARVPVRWTCSMGESATGLIATPESALSIVAPIPASFVIVISMEIHRKLRLSPSPSDRTSMATGSLAGRKLRPVAARSETAVRCSQCRRAASLVGFRASRRWRGRHPVARCCAREGGESVSRREPEGSRVRLP